MNRKIRKRLVAGGHALAPEAPPAAGGKPFLEWFEQDVLGFDTEEYRRAFWREAFRTGHTIGHMPRTFGSWQREYFGPSIGGVANDALLAYFVAGGACLVFWFIREAIRRHLNRVRRPTYYAAERKRRLALARERRRQCRRTTTNPRPSLDAIRALYAQVRGNPEAALRLGGMLEDLECYLDNHPRFEGDRCLGRAGGIKRHLQKHAPDLFEHYSALMRYKAIAKRFRQAAGVADPVPADALLPSAAAERAELAAQKQAATEDRTAPMARGRTAAVRERATAEECAESSARERAAEILAEGAGTVVALEAALALRLDPDCVPALADSAAARTERTPRRILGWLRRRRSA